MRTRLQRAQLSWLASSAAILALGCGKDPPPVAPGAPVAAVASVDPGQPAEPQPPAADPELDDEPPPVGPAVEVNVAEDPGKPLAYFRGASALGAAQVLHWSRKPMGRKTIAIADGQVALRGAAKAEEALRGPAPVQGEGPLLVSIGADWCVPCSHELGDVIELAQQLRDGRPKEGETRLVMVLEGTPDEWPLAEVRDRLFAKHAKHKKLAKPLAKPAWAQFRADLESNWGAAVGRLGVLGGDKVALPLNLLLDRCGHIQAAASGSLDSAKKQAFAGQLARLRDAPCYPAPLEVAPAAAPRPSTRPAAGKPEAKPGQPLPAPAEIAPDPAGTAPGPAGNPPDPGGASATEGGTIPQEREKPEAAPQPGLPGETAPPAARDKGGKPSGAPGDSAPVKPARPATETAKPAAKD